MLIFVLVIVFAVMILIYIISFNSSTQQTQPDVLQLEDIPDPVLSVPQSEYKTFRIAGITNYCNRSDIGCISGELRKDPDNPYDKKAVMIIEANKEKLIGYISRNEKEQYLKFSNNLDRRPFVGYIETYINNEGRTTLYGIIRSYSGDDEIVMNDMQNDWEFLHEAFRIKDYEKRIEVLDRFKY